MHLNDKKIFFLHYAISQLRALCVRIITETLHLCPCHVGKNINCSFLFALSVDSCSVKTKMNCFFFLSAVLAAMTEYGAYSYPDGAPMEACSTLTPQHGDAPTPCDGCLFSLRLTEIDSSPVNEAMAHLYQCGRRHTSKFLDYMAELCVYRYSV